MATFNDDELGSSVRTKINASITKTDAMDQGVATTDSPTFVDLALSGTGAMQIPDGTTAERPSTPITGMFRFNTDGSNFEGYDGTEWGDIGGGGGTELAAVDYYSYGSTTTPIVLSVTVVAKSSAHPYSGSGSTNGYYVDGFEAPALKLSGTDPNAKYVYRFDQSDASNTGHPLRFYLEADRTTPYTTGVTTSGTPGSAGAYTQIAVDANTPPVLYYQCSVHAFMGNYAETVNTVTASSGGGSLANRLFAKDDATAVAWTKTGNGTATTQTALYVEVNGAILTIASGTSIAMPTLAAGTDYAIWAKPDGALEATTDHTNPPVVNARKVGGFHYAPSGNATAQTGGDTTPQINEYSFWDLNFKPACPDPRGMTLVADGFWVDIYLTGVDAITNGSSKYNVTMADGSSPPKVPTMFGGDGTTTYGSYTWFEAQELATAFGKRCLTQLEFMSAAYGTTEGSSIGTDQVSTVLNAAYTSKWGVMLATGNMWVWGRDRGGPAASASWNANTEGRGSEYNAPNGSLFGGHWNIGSLAGSRCSGWGSTASDSTDLIGSRFACDHIQIG